MQPLFQVNFNITCWIHLIYLYILKEKSWMSQSVILGFPNLLHCWFFTLLVQPFYCCCDIKRVSSHFEFSNWTFGWQGKLHGLVQRLSFSPHLTLWPTWCVWTRPDRLCVILHQLLLLSVCPFLSQVSLAFFPFFIFGTASNIGAPVK